MQSKLLPLSFYGSSQFTFAFPLFHLIHPQTNVVFDLPFSTECINLCIYYIARLSNEYAPQIRAQFDDRIFHASILDARREHCRTLLQHTNNPPIMASLKVPTKQLIVDSSEGGSSNKSSSGSEYRSSGSFEAIDDDINEENTYIRKDLEDCATPWNELSHRIYYIDRRGATESPHQTGFKAPDPLTPCPIWGTPECAEFIGRARNVESSPWLSVYTEEPTARKFAHVECGDRLYRIFVPRLQQAGLRVYNPGLMVYNHVPRVGGLTLEDINDTELFVLHKIPKEAVADLLVLLPREYNHFDFELGLIE
jgi:hypothetical protein